jgi:hypothetical protein
MITDNIYKNPPTPLSSWVEKRWAMCEQKHKDAWSVPNSFLEVLFTYKDKMDLTPIHTFIETGTCEGLTADIMAKHFFHVYTIEKFADSEKQLLYLELGKNNPSITFCYGDSKDELQRISSEIFDRKCIILLDAHNGSDSPLIDELAVIKQSYNKDCIILVDDTCDLGTGTWPDKKTFESMVMDINPDYKIVYTDIGRHICLIYPEKKS